MFKNKEGKVRSGWKISAVTVVIYAIIMFLGIVAGIVVGIFLISSGDFSYSTMEYSEYGKTIMNNLNLILMFVQELVFIFTPIIAWKFIMKRPLSNMGIRPIKNHSKELLVGLLFGIVSITIVFCALILSGNAEVDSWRLNFSGDTVIYLLFFISVGFAEEIFGRGFILSTLRQTRNIPVIVIISSVLFAVMHSLNPGIGPIPYLNLTLVGVLFAYIYLKSNNIWMAIGYHITWNYFQGNVFGFKVSGIDTTGLITTLNKNDNILNGGKFGPEGGLFVTAVLLLGFLFVKLYYKNRPFDFLSTEPEVIEQNSESAPLNY